MKSGIFLFDELKVSDVTGRNTAVKFFQLTLHVLDFNLLVFDVFDFIVDKVKVFDVISIIFQEFRIGFKTFAEVFNCSFRLSHSSFHERSKLPSVDINFGDKLGGQNRGNFVSIDVEATFGNIFDFLNNKIIPFCEFMDFWLDFLEGDISFFPVGHLEVFHEHEDFFDLSIIFFNVVWGRFEVISDFIEHVVPDVVELDRLIDDESDIW